MRVTVKLRNGNEGSTVMGVVIVVMQGEVP
jgi:hypothetical protein